MTEEIIKDDYIKSKLAAGSFAVYNNKWGNPSATQNITLSNSKVIANWNNSGSGWNYPEVVAGSDRYCHSMTWAVFPVQKQNITTLTATLIYKFTQKPTSGSWWNFAFDIYFNNQTSGCYSYSNCLYNFMIWIHGLDKFAAGTHISDITDSFGNTWSYYKRSSSPPWDVFVLKNRNQIPYEPTANTQYNISIDIKKFIDTITGISGSWYLPGLELGCENSGSLGNTSGAIEIDGYSLNVNGQSISIGTPVPPPTTKYSYKPACRVIADQNGTYNSIAEATTAAEASGYIVV